MKRYDQLLKEKITHEKLSGLTGSFNRFNYEDKGFLDYQIEDGIVFLIDVEVKEEFRNQGIASKLLESFFKIFSKGDYLLDASGYLEMGEKYIKKKVDSLIKKYNVEEM